MARTVTRTLVGDASGALADLGILVPIASALVLVAGLDAGTVFVGVGLLYVVSGAVFRVPMPVQPVKAAAAIVIANGLPGEQLALAGVMLGATLVILVATGVAEPLARVFAQPIVRGLQLGVGLLLLLGATEMLGYPTAMSLGIAIAVCVLMLWQSSRPDPLPVALLVVVGGMATVALTGAQSPWSGPSLWSPQLLASSSLQPETMWAALTVLVIPQLPLTFGNAVVALTDVQHHQFGERASRVTHRRVGMSMGVANVCAGLFGGMPMCHGAGGLTAHVRSGASTARMNVIIGAPLLLGGLLFGPTLLALLNLIPLAVLAGLLAFTGAVHAWLIADQRGYDLAVATSMGVIGGLTGNLAIALAAGIALYWGPRGARSMQNRRSGTAREARVAER